MTRFLIYLFPAVADVILAASMFVCSNRLADAGRSRTEVGIVFAAWAGVYIVCNQVLAKLVTSRNAAWMMTVANLLFVVISGIFMLVDNLWAIYAVMGGLAVATAMFFLPFQLFMKAVEPDQHQGVVRSVGLYTFSWSLGFAAGPFIAGFIYQWFGWQWCFVFTSLLGLLTAMGVQLLKHHAKHHHGEEVVTEPPMTVPPEGSAGDINYHRMPDLAWLGWIVAGVGCVGIYSFLALLPSIGVKFEISKSQIGSIIALLYIVQALMGLGLMRFRMWMFRPGPTVGLAGFGLVSLLFFAAALLPSVAGVNACSIPLRTLFLYMSAASYGMFSGAFFFELVFYSLVHPQRNAKYVAINEAVVGICGVAGPVIAGMLADNFGFVAFPTTQSVMIAAAMVVQFVVLRRLARMQS